MPPKHSTQTMGQRGNLFLFWKKNPVSLYQTVFRAIKVVKDSIKKYHTEENFQQSVSLEYKERERIKANRKGVISKETLKAGLQKTTFSFRGGVHIWRLFGRFFSQNSNCVIKQFEIF